MSTLKLFGADMGNTVLFIRADFSDKSSPVEINYNDGRGWIATEYKTSETWGTNFGLWRLGRYLAADFLHMCRTGFGCGYVVFD
jgi:hypothetical protein